MLERNYLGVPISSGPILLASLLITLVSGLTHVPDRMNSLQSVLNNGLLLHSLETQVSNSFAIRYPKSKSAPMKITPILLIDALLLYFPCRLYCLLGYHTG